ncbi:MAG: hypothetical protein PGN25_14710 [Methylorubrum populi]
MQPLRIPCFVLLASAALLGTARAGPVTDRWSAEAAETRAGRELRTIVTFSYAGEVSNGRALWRVAVRCEAREPGAAWTTTVTASGKAMLAQGAFAGTADPVGDVFVLEPDNDTARGKGRLEVGDARCASGIPMVRKLLESPPPMVAPKAETSGRPWDHNGSLVMIDPAVGIVTYLEPKASLKPVVEEGTVLFRGQIHPDGPVSGTAYAFKAGCAPAAYSVRGTYANGANALTLRGAGPVRRGCEVVGYSTSSPHAALRFTYLLDD